MERAGQPADATSFNYAFVSKALLRAYQGRWRSIIRASNDWAARVRLAGRYQAATARLIWSVANLYLGNVAAARAGLLDALDGLERMQPFGQLYLALAEVQLGNEEEANALVDRYLRACGGQPRTSHDSAVFGDVVSRLSRPALWQLGYQALERERAHLVGPYSPVSTRRVLGRLATRLNRWPEAEKHFEEATRVLSDGGAKWELAQTLLDYAEMRRVRRRRGDMTKAAALQMRASELLQQLRVPQAPAPQAPPAKEANEFALTGRELEVLDLLAQGYRNQEIAKALTISPGTARRHIENILSKMGAANRTDAVVLAISKQLVGPLQEQQRRPASSPAPEVASRARSAG
jgi:ATP/maltotriose-dependent transcriptional regulator MalT